MFTAKSLSTPKCRADTVYQENEIRVPRSLYCSFAYTHYTVREKRDIEAIMSSHFVVPNWRNLNHQKQLEEQIKEEVEETAPQGEGGEGRRGGGSQRNRSSSSSSSSHFHTQHFTTLSVPIMSSHYEVAELTWENGQLAMHGLSGGGGGLLPSDPVPKPLWTQAGAGAGADTLESIVHGATTSCPNPNTNSNLNDQKIHSQNHPRNMDSLIASSSEKWTDRNTCQMGPKPMNKRSRSESVPVRRNYSSANDFPRRLDGSACASATFFGDTDTNMMTVTSSEYSPCSLKAKNTDEDSAFHDSRRVNQDEECDQTKTETGRSHSSRRIRVAAVHNQSERKRRDRINQKMKALQKLVPNSSKTDKASMLDEVIGYLKQLQTQIQMIQSVGNTMPNPHQMLMPSTALGIQQQQQHQQLQQMSLLARMATGMGLGGMGMGMLDMNSMASSAFPSLLPQPTRPSIPTTTTPAFVPSPFLVPQMMQARMNMSVPGSSNNILNPSLPMPNPYSALLQQSMNMDLYNKMAAFYGQQLKQTTQEPMSSNSSQMKHIHNRD